MRKKLICMLLAASMVLSGSVMAFAAEGEEDQAQEETTRVIVPNMQFTGTTINLSLNQAVERMQTTGLKAQTAELNKQSDQIVAQGLQEDTTALNRMVRRYNSTGLLDTADINTNQKILALRKEFAENHLEANNQAELNQIEYETVKMYYSVLLAQDQLKSAEDNLQRQKDILANTNKKFELGTVAKIDVLSAENKVVIAEKDVLSAKNALTDAKMGFNLLLGYPLMQDVNLTDSLVEVEAPTTSLTTAINNALENRMELPGAKLGLELNEILLSSMQYTTLKTSSTYKNQEVAILIAQQNLENAPLAIEQEIRSLYLDIETKKTELATAKANLELAQEAYRISTISFDAGMNTLVDVQEAQDTVFQVSMGVSLATMNYDMAVYSYNFAQGVGTQRVALS